MPSLSLQHLQASVTEIDTLQGANPSPTGAAPRQPDLTRVIGRASIVLLSSHLERYLREVNEEAIALINFATVPSELIPETIRLVHSKKPIDDLAETQWNHRAAKLQQVMTEDGCLWRPGELACVLDHARVLEWMASPKCKEIERFFQQWGVSDVFAKITRSPRTRRDLWLNLTALVEKRNNIAHGDIGEQAPQKDIKLYKSAVLTFCTRVDRLYGRHLSTIFRIPLPW